MRKINTGFYARIQILIVTLGIVVLFTGCGLFNNNDKEKTTELETTIEQNVNENTTIEQTAIKESMTEELTTEETTTEKTTTAEMVMNEKMQTIRKMIDNNNFIDYFMEAVFMSEYDLTAKTTEEDKWELVANACVVMEGSKYLSDEVKRVYVDDWTYLLVPVQDIEEICMIYFGRMLDKSQITKESSVIYSEEHQIYYVEYTGFVGGTCTVTKVENPSADQFVVTLDRMHNKIEFKEDEIIEQLKIVLKYNPDTKVGFSFAGAERLFQKEDGEPGQEESVTVSDHKEEKKNEEKKKNMEKVISNITKSEKLWRGVIYSFAYEFFGPEEYYGRKDMKAIVQAARIIKGSKFDDKDIETVNENDSKYLKISKKLVNEIKTVYKPLLSEYYYSSLDESPVDYYEKGKSYYIEIPDENELEISVGETYVEEEEADGKIKYTGTIELIEDSNLTGKELGRYYIKIKANPGSENRFGFIIQDIRYEKNN